MPTVLIAGGAGYIGSHTAKTLSKAGITPVTLDNLVTGNRQSVLYGPFCEGTIEDKILVKEIVEKHKPICAMLFAGHAYVGESTENPKKYFRNNIANALTFLDALGNSIPVVFSSSCSIYGIQKDTKLINEDSIPGPLNPYAETKLFLEKILKAYNKAYNLQYAILRYFNAAGADPDFELGEHHDPETHLIPLTIQAALTQTQPLKVFGTDYETPDGTAIRDYTHVTDLADGHVRALDHLLKNKNSSITVNLGTGTGHSVKEVITAVEKETKQKVQAIYSPRREGDPAILVADPKKAKSLLSWTPKHSDLETIVKTAVRWHKANRWT